MYNLVSTQLPFNQTKSSMPGSYYWSTAIADNCNKPACTDSSSSPTSTINDENSDDHFSRHLENLVTNLNKQFEDEEEEYDENDDDGNNEDANDETENETKTIGEDDKDDLTNKDDEPKVFQVEDVDLPPLVTSSLSKTLTIASPSTASTRIFNTSRTVIKLSMTNCQTNKLTNDAKLNQQNVSVFMFKCF